MKTVIVALSLAWLLIPASSGEQSNQHSNTSALRGVWKQVESKPASGEASRKESNHCREIDVVANRAERQPFRRDTDHRAE